jgi:hypothetical protein
MEEIATMNSMQMLKNSITTKNRIVANVMIRKMGVDVGSLTNEKLEESTGDYGYVLMEIPNGDQFYVVGDELHEDSYNGLPVFSRKDLVALRGLV